MRNKVSVFVLVCLAVSLCASNILVQAEEQIIDWIQLTVDQKWNRATHNYDLALIYGIAYSKSLGRTPENFGKFVGDLVALKWEGIEGVSEK